MPPMKKSTVKRMSIFQYPSVAAIMEFIEARKRIVLSLFCPSLRSIENAVPLYLDKLEFYPNCIEINKKYYYWENLTCQEAMEMLFKNRKSPIRVHEMEAYHLGTVRFPCKFRPTILYLNEKEENDVIFGNSAESFCTKNLKRLSYGIERRGGDFFSHPILNQLEHLRLWATDDNVRDYIDRFLKLPIPNLTIPFVEPDYPFNALPILEYWIRRKIPHKKLMLEDESGPEPTRYLLDYLVEKLRDIFELKEGTLDEEKCWIVSNDDADSDSDSDVVITINENYEYFHERRCSMDIQVLPRGTAKV